MISDKESLDKIVLKKGDTVILETKFPFRYVIETVGGTTIKGVATPNFPLELRNGGDIKNAKIIIDEDCIKSLSLA